MIAHISHCSKFLHLSKFDRSRSQICINRIASQAGRVKRPIRLMKASKLAPCFCSRLPNGLAIQFEQISLAISGTNLII